MKTRFVRTALAVCLLGSAAALTALVPVSPAVAADAAKPPSVSAPVGKLLEAAHKLMDANDYAGALVLIKQAQALPNQTGIDTYEINHFLAITAFNLNDHATADTAFEAMAESPDMPADDKPSMLHNAILFASEAKHDDKVIKYAQELSALGGPPDAPVLASLAQAYYHANDFPNAEAASLKAVAATPAGATPNRGALEIALASELKLNKQDDAFKVLETIVTNFDESEEWGQLVDVSLSIKGMKDLDALNMYRLKIATRSANGPDDYTVMASLALQNGYPVEAQAALEAGLAAGKVTNSGKSAAQLAEARGRAAKDRASLPAFEAAAVKSPNGELDVKLAETLYGYGRYADAVTAAKRGLGKGGAKTDANEANMIIGMALAMQGDTAGAQAALDNIKNGAPATMRAQHLWSLYVGRKYATAAH